MEHDKSLVVMRTGDMVDSRQTAWTPGLWSRGRGGGTSSNTETTRHTKSGIRSFIIVLMVERLSSIPNTTIYASPISFTMNQQLTSMYLLNKDRRYNRL